MRVEPATDRDRAAAHEVWRAAREAVGRPPTDARIARVHAKLAEPDALVLVGRDGDEDENEVVAMAVAEALRADLGAGAVVDGWAHVSMVFVAPAHWGRGLGGALMTALHTAAADRGWASTGVWTRASNERARRLYERCGYRLAGPPDLGPAADRIVRYLRDRSV